MCCCERVEKKEEKKTIVAAEYGGTGQLHVELQDDGEDKNEIKLQETEDFSFKLLLEPTSGIEFVPSHEYLLCLAKEKLSPLTKLHYKKHKRGLMTLSFEFSDGTINPPLEGFYEKVTADTVSAVSDGPHVGSMTFGLANYLPKDDGQLFLFQITTKDHQENTLLEIELHLKPNRDPFHFTLTENQIIVSVRLDHYMSFPNRI